MTIPLWIVTLIAVWGFAIGIAIMDEHASRDSYLGTPFFGCIALVGAIMFTVALAMGWLFWGRS